MANKHYGKCLLHAINKLHAQDNQCEYAVVIA